jgi:hypothetical protein
MLKLIMAILIFIHALIHLLGLVRAFYPDRITQFSAFISKPAGLVWLFAALLFILCTLAFLTGQDWWWMAALPAVVISQTLIIIYWQDARFGTIPNLVILVAILVAFATWNFNLQTGRDIEALLSETRAEKNVITSEMLSDLPAPVQKWLHYSGVVGREAIHSVYLKQTGVMKLSPDQKRWISSEAEQSFDTVEPRFIWRVNTTMYGLPVVGRDDYNDGKGKMLIKLAGLLPVVDLADQPKLNESTMQRYLGEIVWFPSAALNPYISWEAVDDNSARATMEYAGIKGTAMFYFDQQGEPIKVVIPRYREMSDEKPTDWMAEIKAMDEVDGIRIPVTVEASWLPEEGTFTWYIFEISYISFKPSHMSLE